MVIFIEMGKQFQQYLSRRVMTEEGWALFCVQCGQYVAETNFYKKKGSTWGYDSRCKIHYTRKDKDDDGEMDYLKLNPLTEDDFIQTQIMLEKMGFKFGPGEKSVHEQFMDRHPHLKNFNNDKDDK
jgi:hypothetical protein